MDYDLGDATQPYHAQLIATGATEEALADVRYQATRWQPPDALMQQQAEARARRAGHMTDVADAGADTTIPGGRKRANTTSRWEGRRRRRTRDGTRRSETGRQTSAARRGRGVGPAGLHPYPVALRSMPPPHPTPHALARVGGSPQIPPKSTYVMRRRGWPRAAPAAAYETRLAHNCRAHSGPVPFH